LRHPEPGVEVMARFSRQGFFVEKGGIRDPS